jgi:predicted metal-dependent HD superfamily phosphohydrolase
MTNYENEKTKTLFALQNKLKERFIKAIIKKGGKKDCCEIYFNHIWDEYTNPGRKYHTINHIADCLTEFDSIKHLAQNPFAVEMGIFYHDYWYDTHATNNEDISAVKLTSDLSNFAIRDCDIDAAKKIVMATKPGVVAKTIDEMIAADCDLSVLAKDSNNYEIYRKNIRKEYSWVPSEVFNPKRAEILQIFLQRAHIYQTEFMRNKVNFETGKTYEVQARENLKRDIEKCLNS